MAGGREVGAFPRRKLPDEAKRRGELPRRLTERELGVVSLVAEGKTNREIAAWVGTTENMVKNYLRIIYDKLGVWNRTELALWYVTREVERPAS